MDVFKGAWENQVRILTEAVDDIVTVDDFLAVSENHILEDVNKCCLALQEGDSETLDRIAGTIRGRSTRISDVVSAEMDNYEPGYYTEKVLEAVKVLRNEFIPMFNNQVRQIEKNILWLTTYLNVLQKKNFSLAGKKFPLIYHFPHNN